MLQSDTESSVNNSLITLDTTKANDGQLHEANTSQLLKTQEKLCSDSSVSIGDLLLKMPQLLLKQGNEVSQVSTYVFICTHITLHYICI